MPPKRDYITFLLGYLNSGLPGVSSRADDGARGPDGADEVVRFVRPDLGRVTLFVIVNSRFDEVQVSEVGVQILDLGDEVRKGRFRVIHAHI